MNRLAPLVLAFVLTLSGCAGAGVAPPVADDAGSADRIGGVSAPEDGADPETDRLGWEAGYWYDERITVTAEDGLNESEQAAVVGRTMARVEYLRGLEFRGDVPVEVVSRDSFRQQTRNSSVAPARRAFDNAKYEALFMINESRDSIAVQNTNAGATVGGYYSPSNDRIVIVGDGAGVLLLNERTLAHELTHAVQDQHFDIGRYDRSTRERANALSGLIEGDASYTEHLYDKRCEGNWDCLERPPNAGGGGGGGLANIGPYLITYQPYSDGPTFVRSLYREGGWSAVNDAYANPPASTEQVIHPRRYPGDRPVVPRVADRTSGTWERIPVEHRPNHAELGEAGTNAMLVYPLFDSGGATRVVAASHFFNRQNGEVSEFDPYNYDHPYTDGIRGDRLVPYRNADNETGYVWALRFDSAAEVREFRRGYTQVLEYRNASVVEGAEGPGTVYRIPEDDPNGFGDAFRVVADGDTLVVTNAPTVAELDDVHAPA